MIDLKRAVVSVATGSFVRGLDRLANLLAQQGEPLRQWKNLLPVGCPTHEDVPYAFKAYALMAAAEENTDLVIWCDASVIPIRPLDRVWRKIHQDGYWISRNGWDNADWTADDAYAELFPSKPIEEARAINKKIPHVVGTAFGLNLRSPLGLGFLTEYYRLASETRAFCGPWQNAIVSTVAGRNEGRRVALCGPRTTLGHRHDQTAMSVIAHNLKMELTNGPSIFAYALRDDDGKPELNPAQYSYDTCLLAVGV